MDEPQPESNGPDIAPEGWTVCYSKSIYGGRTYVSKFYTRTDIGPANELDDWYFFDVTGAFEPEEKREIPFLETAEYQADVLDYLYDKIGELIRLFGQPRFAQEFQERLTELRVFAAEVFPEENIGSRLALAAQCLEDDFIAIPGTEKFRKKILDTRSIIEIEKKQILSFAHERFCKKKNS
jgi:hypothetical protein